MTFFRRSRKHAGRSARKFDMPTSLSSPTDINYISNTGTISGDRSLRISEIEESSESSTSESTNGTTDYSELSSSTNSTFTTRSNVSSSRKQNIKSKGRKVPYFLFQ